jgi:AraC-like DNA-binding protein
MGYLDRHLQEDLDADQLAERFFVSKFHMMRIFKAQTGFTIHNYLMQRRLLAARNLIEKGMRATEACYRCGFRSYSSFTRAYSKHFGTTPTGRIPPSQLQTEGAE